MSTSYVPHAGATHKFLAPGSPTHQTHWYKQIGDCWFAWYAHGCRWFPMPEWFTAEALEDIDQPPGEQKR